LYRIIKYINGQRGKQLLMEYRAKYKSDIGQSVCKYNLYCDRNNSNRLYRHNNSNR